MAKITLATGIKEFEIADENDVVRGKIRFNSTDANFIVRAMRMSKDVEAWIDEVSNLDENMSEMDIANLIVDTDKKIKTAINNLFNDDNLSNVVFAGQSCLNIQPNGKPFVINFLEVIMPLVTADLDTVAEKAKQTADKYISEVK